jgi:hypothetical protein
MSLILKQRKLFSTKIFEIKDNSFRVEAKSFGGHTEYELKYEEITNRVIRRKMQHLYTLIPCILLFVLVLITLCSHLLEAKGSSWEDILLYAFLFLVFLVLAIFNFENVVEVHLFGTGKLLFYANSPNKIAVDNFITSLLKKHKEYLLNRYAKADPYTSPEQLAVNLNTLRDRNIIDDEELENLRNKLIPKPGAGSVGFKITPSSN